MRPPPGTRTKTPAGSSSHLRRQAESIEDERVLAAVAEQPAPPRRRPESDLELDRPLAPARGARLRRQRNRYRAVPGERPQGAHVPWRDVSMICSRDGLEAALDARRAGERVLRARFARWRRLLYRACGLRAHRPPSSSTAATSAATYAASASSASTRPRPGLANGTSRSCTTSSTTAGAYATPAAGGPGSGSVPGSRQR